MTQSIGETHSMKAQTKKTSKRSGGAWAKTITSQKVKVIKIGEARDALSLMVSSLESGASETYVLGPFGKPSAALVSYRRFEPLFTRGNKKAKLAMLIVEDLLEDAPQHLKSPALAELSQLPVSDLMTLLRLDALPEDEQTAAVERKKLRHPIIFDRLRQRAKVASAIAEARSAGLYEMAEDAASDAIVLSGD